MNPMFKAGEGNPLKGVQRDPNLEVNGGESLSLEEAAPPSIDEVIAETTNPLTAKQKVHRSFKVFGEDLKKLGEPFKLIRDEGLVRGVFILGKLTDVIPFESRETLINKRIQQLNENEIKEGTPLDLWRKGDRSMSMKNIRAELLKAEIRENHLLKPESKKDLFDQLKRKGTSTYEAVMKEYIIRLNALEKKDYSAFVDFIDRSGTPGQKQKIKENIHSNDQETWEILVSDAEKGHPLAEGIKQILTYLFNLKDK